MTAALKPISFSRRERRAYGLAASIGALAADRVDRSSGIAFDVDKQLRKEWPDYPLQSERSLLVPYDALDMAFARTGLEVGTAGLGGDLVFTEGRRWVDILRVQSVTLRAGAMFIPGLRGPAAFPVIASAETVESVAENAGTDTTQTDISFTQVALDPYELQSVTSWSRQLLKQSAEVAGNAIDEIVATSIARQHAVQVDTLALGGLGSSNQPTGIATQLASPQLITLGNDSGNGGNPTWQDMAAIEAAVANANAAFPEFDADGTDTGAPRSSLILSPTMRWQLRVTDRGAASSTVTGRFILESDRLFRTHPVLVTNALPQAITVGSATTCEAIVFGVFRDLYIGFWGPGLELIVDPFTLKKQGMIELASFQLFSPAVIRPGSFAGCTDALPTLT